MRDHTKLKAFQLADRLALLTYNITAAFPRREMFGLTSQMRRAAVSVPSNIVEGCARETISDYVRFLGIAYGSTKELEYQASLAQRLGFLQSSAYGEFRELCVETAKTLNGLICALRTCSATTHGPRVQVQRLKPNA